ncbi:GNAT family N-acetyltransferase [Halorubrum sp. HHNYT27]|uniref:GNAT family N-acetyltransferase n=1 Tax=Halorubrum sp. HHNYT27 TaxID=3402275 RepID=UPI003EC08454
MSRDEIRELTKSNEFRAAFPVLRQLRDHLTEAQYEEYLDEMRNEGYRLFAVFEQGDIVAVAGVVIQTNFYNGRHLFVADLVTDKDHRSEGYGERLMQFLTQWARNNDCDCVTLESGLWRDDAHRFYENRLGMDRYCYTFKKEIRTV